MSDRLKPDPEQQHKHFVPVGIDLEDGIIETREAFSFERSPEPDDLKEEGFEAGAPVQAAPSINAEHRAKHYEGEGKISVDELLKTHGFSRTEAINEARDSTDKAFGGSGGRHSEKRALNEEVAALQADRLVSGKTSDRPVVPDSPSINQRLSGEAARVAPKEETKPTQTPRPNPGNMPLKKPQPPLNTETRPDPAQPKSAERPKTQAEKEKSAEKKVETIRVASMTAPKHEKYTRLERKPAIIKLKRTLKSQGVDWNDPKNSSDLRVSRLKRWEAEGDKIPDQLVKANQDAILVDKDRKLFVVADGVGGYSGGELASNIVVDTFNRPQSFDQESIDPKVAAAELLTNFDIARAKMKDAAVQDPNLEKMGAAVVAAQIINGNQLVFASAGDSMIGVFKSNGRLHWLNTEQGEGNKIYNVVDARHSPGREDFRIRTTNKDETGMVVLEAGDRVVMVSDGVLGDEKKDRLSQKDYADALGQKTPEEAQKALYEASRKYDDTSIIIFDFNPEGFENTDTSATTPEATAAASEAGEFRSFEGKIDWPTEDIDNVASTATHPNIPPVPPESPAETTGEMPRILTTEIFNAASLLREERRVDSEESDALKELMAELTESAVKEDEGKVKDLIRLIGEQKALEAEYFNKLAEVKESDDNRMRRRDMRTAVRESYNTSMLGGKYENDEGKIEDGTNYDKEISDLRKALRDGLKRGQKKAIDELVKEIERLPVSAWEGEDLEGRIEEEAAILEKDPARRQAVQDTLKSLVGMEEEKWRDTVENGQLLQRNAQVESPRYRQESLNQMMRNGLDRRGSYENTTIREARFIKYILDAMPEVARSGRSPVEEFANVFDLPTKINDFLYMSEELYPGSAGYNRRYSVLLNEAKDFLAAKQLAEMPEALIRDERIVPSDFSRYGQERDRPREAMNVATAREMMRELDDTNRLADEYLNQVERVKRLRNSRIPGRYSLAVARMNRFKQRLNSVRIQNQNAGGTRIVETR